MNKGTKFAALLSVVLFALASFSAERSLTLTSPVSVNGTKLAAGNYKIRYNVNGSTADVQFLKGKKTVVSTSAQVVETNKPNRDSIITEHDESGDTKLIGLQFANQSTEIRFGSESGSSGGN